MPRQNRHSELEIPEQVDTEIDTDTADTLNDIVRPFISVLLELHSIRSENRPQAEAVHAQIRKFLEETMARAKSLQLPAEDLRDLRYALVAFADELMQLEAGRFKDFWRSHSLQEEHFDEALAGEGFFKKLSQLRADPRRFPVLQVYYLCMLFGFRGKYRGSEELAFETLLDEVRLEIERRAVSPGVFKLAPRGYRPDDPGADTKRNLLLQSLAIVAAIVSLFWYIGLKLVISDEAGDLRIQLQEKAQEVNN
jgi:type VI secretion system protein ImpK